MDTQTDAPALSLKERLARKPRKLIATIDVDGERVELRRPSHDERTSTIEAAQAAGEVDDKGHPNSPRNGLRLLARFFAAVAHEPGTGQRIYSPTSTEDVEAIATAPWLEDVQTATTKAFHPTLEEARGNS